MEELTIEFPDSAAADASRLAEDLARHVSTTIDGVKAEVASGSTDAMDFGATVVIVLGTPSIVYLAKGIADWIQRKGDPALVIKRGRESIIVKDGLDQATKREIILSALSRMDG